MPRAETIQRLLTTNAAKEGINQRQSNFTNGRLSLKGAEERNQEVILESQFNPSNIVKTSMYHDMVAGIGLESPTSSYGIRIKVDSNRFLCAQLINMLIRNNPGLPNSHGKTYINS